MNFTFPIRISPNALRSRTIGIASLQFIAKRGTHENRNFYHQKQCRKIKKKKPKRILSKTGVNANIIYYRGYINFNEIPTSLNPLLSSVGFNKLSKYIFIFFFFCEQYNTTYGYYSLSECRRLLFSRRVFR